MRDWFSDKVHWIVGFLVGVPLAVEFALGFLPDFLGFLDELLLLLVTGLVYVLTRAARATDPTWWRRGVHWITSSLVFSALCVDIGEDFFFDLFTWVDEAYLILVWFVVTKLTSATRSVSSFVQNGKKALA